MSHRWFVHPEAENPAEDSEWPNGSAERKRDAQKAAMEAYIDTLIKKGPGFNLRITLVHDESAGPLPAGYRLYLPGQTGITSERQLAAAEVLHLHGKRIAIAAALLILIAGAVLLPMLRSYL